MAVMARYQARFSEPMSSTGIQRILKACGAKTAALIAPTWSSGTPPWRSQNGIAIMA